MKRLYSSLILFGTLVAMVATVFSVILQLRPKRLELTAQIRTSEELTPTQEVPDLTSNFQYRGEKVDRLWKVTCAFTNTGDKTIIGKGSQKNIMDDELCFVLADKFRVLNQVVEKGDFPGTVSHDDTQVCFSFSQWRRSETGVVSFFVAGSKDSATPRIAAKGRDLIDGEIVLKGPPTAAPPAKSLLEHLPSSVAIPAKAVGAISTFVWGGLLFVFGTLAIRDMMRTRRWSEKNLDQLRTFLAERGIPEDLRIKYLKSPNTITKGLWAQYPGEKLSVFYDAPDFSNPLAAIGPFFLFTFLGIVTALVGLSVFITY